MAWKAKVRDTLGHVMNMNRVRNQQTLSALLRSSLPFSLHGTNNYLDDSKIWFVRLYKQALVSKVLMLTGLSILRLTFISHSRFRLERLPEIRAPKPSSPYFIVNLRHHVT